MAPKLETFYRTMNQAIEAAKKNAEEQGYTVADDIDNINTWEPMTYETTQTKLFALYKNNVKSRKGLNITLYRMRSGVYELTTYIN